MTDNALRLIIERIERLYEERAGITDDIKDAFSEAKARGYDTKMVRRVIARRAMTPDERGEEDALLTTYEAALDMDQEEAEATIAETRPDAAAIALNLLTAEIVGLEDENHASALVEHVLFLLDLRAEIALLRQQEAQRKKLAKEEGFDAKQIGVTVRWFEKCVKHGEDAMRAGEATFHLYRGTVEQRDRAAQSGPVSGDDKLSALFAPPPSSKPKQSKLSGTLAIMRAVDAATRNGGNRG